MAGPPAQHARSDAELSEVDLLLRVARRWRRLGAGTMGEQQLSPHQERGLLALARLVRRTEQNDHAAPAPASAPAPAPSSAPAPALTRAAVPAGVRISHLADHLGIAPRSATEVADALETAGLVERAPDPTDRRAVLLTLTDKGRQAVGRVRAERRAAAEEAMSTLGSVSTPRTSNA